MPSRTPASCAAVLRTAAALLAALACGAVADAQIRIDEFLINHGPSDPAFLSSVIEGHDGDFYGTFQRAPSGDACGGVFRFSRTTQVFTVLHSFTENEGCHPNRLVERADGVFYGTTRTGGAGSFGTVFSLTSDGGFAVIHSFAGSDGLAPSGGLILSTDGNVYGTTSGSYIFGISATFFKIGVLGDFETLAVFDDAGGFSGPAFTNGPIVEAPDGSFYGTTSNGGAYSSGAIYRFTPAGDISILHSFVGPDLVQPYGGLATGSDGNYYGTTTYGGGFNAGGIFRMTPGGTVTTVHFFPSGVHAVNGLIDGGDGFLYGNTYAGLFRASFDGAVTGLVGSLGSDTGSLVKALDGHIWGASERDDGKLFRLHAPES